MKKLIMLFSILFVLGLATDVMGQTPVTRTSSNASKTQSTVNSSSNSSVNRELKKADSQMSKANNSYQRVQSGQTASPTTKPTTTSTARPSTSSTARPTTTTSSRPTTSTTVKPTTGTSTTVKPSTTTSSASSQTTVNKPTTTTSSNTNTARPTTTTSTSSATLNKPTTTTNNSSSSSATEKTLSSTSGQLSAVTNRDVTAANTRRGYSSAGEATPQAAPNSGYKPGGHGVGAPNPYMHPNHHGFGGHMNVHDRYLPRPVYYGGVPYYFYNSVFCRHINGYYVICRPPIGAVIAYAIFHTWNPVIVVHKNVRYYYDDGTFYLPHNNNYVVVNPPIGACLSELPSNYEVIVLDNNVYFKVDNVYYKEVVINGYIWYQVEYVGRS